MSVSGISSSSAAWELLAQQRAAAAAAASGAAASTAATDDMATASPLSDATPVGGGGPMLQLSPQLFQILGGLQPGQAASNDPTTSPPLAGSVNTDQTATGSSAAGLTSASLAADATSLLGELQSFIAQMQAGGAGPASTGTTTAASTGTAPSSSGTAASATDRDQTQAHHHHHHHVAQALDSYSSQTSAADATASVGSQTSVTA